jgi:hypothetical protein
VTSGQGSIALLIPVSSDVDIDSRLTHDPRLSGDR